MKRAVLVLAVAMVLVGMLAVPALAATDTVDLASGVTPTAVYGPIGAYAPPGDAAWGETPRGAVLVDPVTAVWEDIPGAYWITSPASTTDDWKGDTWRWYHFEFTVPIDAFNITGLTTLAVNSDNVERVWINDSVVGEELYVDTATFVDTYAWATIKNYDFTPVFGVNSVDIVVRNFALASGTAASNPTAVIYKASGAYEYLTPSALGKTTGGIKFMVGETEVQLDFVAMSTDNGVKGNVKYANSNGVTFWGKVTGYAQFDNKACFTGEIVKGSDYDAGNRYFYVAVSDNGEGASADPDQGVRVLSGTTPYAPNLSLANGSYEAFTGNVQIH